jgi:phosphoribosylaminoimidazole-succinocarboxamide synthase
MTALAEDLAMEKRQELYRGKAKTVYATDDPHRLVMHYRDDVSAFDGVKLAQLPQKGETNNKINAYVMGKLMAADVPTHFVRVLNDRESLVKAMKMVPVECVVRNICAGSMAKRYGIEEGHEAARADLRILSQERCVCTIRWSMTTTSACWDGRVPMKSRR